MSLGAQITIDAGAFFPDFGVAVVFGAQSTTGILDENDAPVPGAESSFDVDVRSTTVIIRTGSLTGLTHDSAITIDGRNFVLRRAPLEAEGKLTILVVAPA